MGKCWESRLFLNQPLAFNVYRKVILYFPNRMALISPKPKGIVHYASEVIQKVCEGERTGFVSKDNLFLFYFTTGNILHQGWITGRRVKREFRPFPNKLLGNGPPKLGRCTTPSYFFRNLLTLFAIFFKPMVIYPWLCGGQGKGQSVCN